VLKAVARGGSNGDGVGEYAAIAGVG